MLQSFRELDFYQDAYQLALEIPAVIAEGWGRREHPKDFKHFLAIAVSSGEEQQVHLDFCRDLGYLDPEQHADWQSRYQSVIRRTVAFSKRWERF